MFVSARLISVGTVAGTDDPGADGRTNKKEIGVGLVASDREESAPIIQLANRVANSSASEVFDAHNISPAEAEVVQSISSLLNPS